MAGYLSASYFDMVHGSGENTDMRSASKSPGTQAEETIRQIAQQHGIDPNPSYQDEWADKIAELSGQENNRSDEVEQLLINLRRAKVITSQRSRALFAEYMEEKYGYR
ncbi:hypothetical protein G6L37_01780 [Agrobacterium rubi]|nr:hypothetical protein [Agrobacterium rubi]NTF24124.1 hypothetical protein [Agrobacterium rubi]